MEPYSGALLVIAFGPAGVPWQAKIVCLAISVPVHQAVRARDLAIGQVGERLLWARLVAGSGGDLHVFLPLEDRGIDGIVHRISTDAHARVQVKVRSWHRSLTQDGLDPRPCPLPPGEHCCAQPTP